MLANTLRTEQFQRRNRNTKSYYEICSLGQNIEYEDTNRPFVRGAATKTCCLQFGFKPILGFIKTGSVILNTNTPVEACEMEPKGSLKVPYGRNFQWFLSETQLCRSRGPSPASDPDLPAKLRRASGHRHEGIRSGTSEDLDPRADGFLVCLTFPAVAPHADAPYFSLFWPVPE